MSPRSGWKLVILAEMPRDQGIREGQPRSEAARRAGCEAPKPLVRGQEGAAGDEARELFSLIRA